jgi:hypothetical protein
VVCKLLRVASVPVVLGCCNCVLSIKISFIQKKKKKKNKKKIKKKKKNNI